MWATSLSTGKQAKVAGAALLRSRRKREGEMPRVAHAAKDAPPHIISVGRRDCVPCLLTPHRFSRGGRMRTAATVRRNASPGDCARRAACQACRPLRRASGTRWPMNTFCASSHFASHEHCSLHLIPFGGGLYTIRRRGRGTCTAGRRGAVPVPGAGHRWSAVALKHYLFML